MEKIVFSARVSINLSSSKISFPPFFVFSFRGRVVDIFFLKRRIFSLSLLKLTFHISHYHHNSVFIKDDVAPALDGDWREFRAKLVASQATAELPDEQIDVEQLQQQMQAGGEGGTNNQEKEKRIKRRNLDPVSSMMRLITLKLKARKNAIDAKEKRRRRIWSYLKHKTRDSLKTKLGRTSSPSRRKVR